MPPTTQLSTLDQFVSAAADSRPTTIAVMVSSADGRATVDGRVAGLTGAADQRVLLGLREAASAVVVGGATARAEGYDSLLDNDARARRVQRGLAPEPEFVVATRQGPDVGEIWDDLRGRHPDGLIVSEGGPRLLGVELAADLIDQLVLCVSPHLVNDPTQTRIVELDDVLLRPLTVLDVAVQDGFVFLRYGAAS